MKNFFKEHLWWLGLIPLVLLVLVIIGANVWGIYEMFSNIWIFSKKNVGLLIFNILSIPFAIFGGINFLRSGYMLLEKDGEKFGFYKGWHASLYFLAVVISYAACVYWITQYK